jgi:hypothetical protein
MIPPLSSSTLTVLSSPRFAAWCIGIPPRVPMHIYQNCFRTQTCQNWPLLPACWLVSSPIFREWEPNSVKSMHLQGKGLNATDIPGRYAFKLAPRVRSVKTISNKSPRVQARMSGVRPSLSTHCTKHITNINLSRFLIPYSFFFSLPQNSTCISTWAQQRKILFEFCKA